MELARLQNVIVAQLRPAVRRLAERHPQFVARVLRRLVVQSPSRFLAGFWRDDGDREEFAATVAWEETSRPAGAIGSVWLVILLQLLLPALIRAFICWWSESASHRAAVGELRERLAASDALPTAALGWQRLWRMVCPRRDT